MQVRASEEARRAAAAAKGARSGGDQSQDVKFDAEVVQEQEKEQEEEEEEEEEEQVVPDYARNPAGSRPWPVTALYNAQDLVTGDQNGVFYPLSCFRVRPDAKTADGKHLSNSLPYPSAVLLTDNYSPYLHRSDLARRVKDAHTIMDWTPVVPLESGYMGGEQKEQKEQKETEQKGENDSEGGGEGIYRPLKWVTSRHPIDVDSLPVPSEGVTTTVVRGKDWYEREQDGGSGSVGYVVGYLDTDGKEHGRYGSIGRVQSDAVNVFWVGKALLEDGRASPLLMKELNAYVKGGKVPPILDAVFPRMLCKPFHYSVGGDDEGRHEVCEQRSTPAPDAPVDEGSSVENAETTEAKGGEGAVKGEDWRKKAFADAMGKEYVSESTIYMYINMCESLCVYFVRCA